MEDRLDQAAVSPARTGGEARSLLTTAVFDLAIVELRQAWGLELVREIRSQHPGTSVLVTTDPGLREHDRAAMKLGVDGFVVEPLRAEHLQFQIEHAREVRALRREALRLREESNRPSAHGIVGESGEMKHVLHLVMRAAATAVPVAIYGESGTGKELVARAVHEESLRRVGPFVPVNASSVPESLMESELFGYVRGAFTGAAGERTGYIEAASGGTLFLDEIGDLPLPMQGKLLRALQERTIQRVGSSRPIRVDFRLITATNKDLMAEVRGGRFREDLFYRIHVFPIYLPPLRARRSDIPLLVEHFLRRFSEDLGRPVPSIAPGVLETLSLHSWPGNIRELENVIHRIVAMKSAGEMIEPGDLVGRVEEVRGSGAAGGAPVRIRPLDEHITEYVAWAYEQLGRNKARTARMLEIDRTTLYRRLQS